MIRFIFALIAVALSGCVSAPANNPLELSISEIYKDPWAYHGIKVRLRGTFDECISYTCQFCETEGSLVTLNDKYARYDDLNEDELSELAENENMCMGVSFEDDTEIVIRRSNGKQNRISQSTAHDLMEQLARFTTSTIEADYSASCSPIQNPSEPDLYVACTDRASQLRRAKIVQTHIRRPATVGVVNMYGLDRLLAPDAETAAKLIAAFHASRSALHDNKNDPGFLNLVDDEEEWWSDSGISALGGACACNADQCQKNDWPKRFGDVANDSPANPYTCWHAEKVNGAWQFPMQ